MKSYLGYSTNQDLRYQATSGGVGSAILKWMFDTKLIDTSISFRYDNEILQYVPHIIHSFEEYEPVGSIYHEIKLVQFIKEHLDEVRGDFACFCIPCQTQSIRRLLTKSSHKVYIIGLTCSSQQTIDATLYLLRRLHIKPYSVAHIRYRGKGWPSGIQIKTNNGREIYVPNGGSLWTQIFHSRLFIRSKCFACQDTLNKFADVILADPWLPELVCSEKIGKSLIFTYSEVGVNLIHSCAKDRYIDIEDFDNAKTEISQMGTINRKRSYLLNKNLTNKYKKVLNSPLYRCIALCPYFFKYHLRLKNKFEGYLLEKSTHL